MIFGGFSLHEYILNKMHGVIWKRILGKGELMMNTGQLSIITIGIVFESTYYGIVMVDSHAKFNILAINIVNF